MDSNGKLKPKFGYNHWLTFPEEDLSTQPEFPQLDEV
jgi:hypothetical protein